MGIRGAPRPLGEGLRGIPYDGLARAMDMRMSQVRRLLRDAGLPEGRIATVRCVGYQLTRP